MLKQPCSTFNRPQKTAFRVAPHTGVWSKRSLKFCVFNHVSVMLLSTNRRASRLFAFYERFLPILHGYLYTKVVRVPFSKKLGRNVEGLWIAQHEWGADKLAHMLRDLQGFYLKVFLCTLHVHQSKRTVGCSSFCCEARYATPPVYREDSICV